jgi:hypothetical protein
MNGLAIMEKRSSIPHNRFVVPPNSGFPAAE